MSNALDSRMRNEHYSCGGNWEGYILPLDWQHSRPEVGSEFCWGFDNFFCENLFRQFKSGIVQSDL